MPMVVQFRHEYYLVGGTAITLHIRRRRSIDFDMFKPITLNHKGNLDRIVGKMTYGFGVKVQPRAMCAWRVESGKVELLLDLRAGG